jgi:hypothetical protein
MIWAEINPVRAMSNRLTTRDPHKAEVAALHGLAW